jgi:DivIVA domain-containing protein
MKDRDETTLTGFGGQTKKRLTPADVQQKEFRVSFRGYNERDVDEFLDLVTEELQRFETEMMRIRSERASLDPSSSDVDAESKRILDEARARADAIVREAEARASGIPTAAAGDTRAVVAPYLNRERDFLQSLGSLVQEHATTIKTMVEEARRRTESRVSTPAATEVVPASASEAGPEGASIPATQESVAASAPVGDAAAERGEAMPEAPDAATSEDVVVLSSVEPITTPAEDRGDEREAGGVRSLRELFWGED